MAHSMWKSKKKNALQLARERGSGNLGPHLSEPSLRKFGPSRMKNGSSWGEHVSLLKNKPLDAREINAEKLGSALEGTIKGLIGARKSDKVRILVGRELIDGNMEYFLELAPPKLSEYWDLLRHGRTSPTNIRQRRTPAIMKDIPSKKRRAYFKIKDKELTTRLNLLLKKNLI